MRVQREQLSDTKFKLTITADQAVMDQVKQGVVQRLGRDVKVPGFRPGKAPEALVEKQIGAAQLQTEFLEQAVNHLYVEAIQHEKLRPAAQPEINILKFVPFSTLEFSANLEAIGDIKLADYKKFRLAPTSEPVAASDVTAVLDDLRQRAASRQPVKRAAKAGDEALIDFKGRDAKTDEPISGADGQAYPLLLGSGSFIPGFEDKLVGQKAGDETEFTLTFPKDYGTPELRSRKVIFAVSVQEIRAVAKPKADDAFAATVGPFKTLAELKSDIKKQLTTERQRNEQRAYESSLVEKLTEESTIAVPDLLVDEELDRMEAEEKRNIAFRGQTWQEHLDQEGISAEQHRESHRADAGKRIRAGLALAELAQQEGLAVGDKELSDYTAQLKRQYANDPAMMAELGKPENGRDLANRLLTQKALDQLRRYASPTAKKS